MFDNIYSIPVYECWSHHLKEYNKQLTTVVLYVCMSTVVVYTCLRKRNAQIKSRISLNVNRNLTRTNMPVTKCTEWIVCVTVGSWKIRSVFRCLLIYFKAGTDRVNILLDTPRKGRTVYLLTLTLTNGVIFL